MLTFFLGSVPRYILEVISGLCGSLNISERILYVFPSGQYKNILVFYSPLFTSIIWIKSYQIFLPRVCYINLQHYTCMIVDLHNITLLNCIKWQQKAKNIKYGEFYMNKIPQQDQRLSKIVKFMRIFMFTITL